MVRSFRCAEVRAGAAMSTSQHQRRIDLEQFEAVRPPLRLRRDQARWLSPDGAPDAAGRDRDLQRAAARRSIKKVSRRSPAALIKWWVGVTARCGCCCCAGSMSLRAINAHAE